MSQGQKNTDAKRWWDILKKPSTIVVSSLAVACGVLGYVGTRWIVTEKLPPFLEQQLSKTFERPIDLGEVEGFSFNSITFGESTVSVNDEDPDYAVVERVEVDFNILPVIFRRVLPLEVTLIDLDIYLEQDKNGSWLQLPDSDEGGGLPIKFDLTVIAESGEVALLPNEQDKPVNLQLDGEVNYDQTQPAYIEYDLDTQLEGSIVNAVGKTSLKTGETKTQILVSSLSLPKVVSLLPNEPPVNLTGGELNADLDVFIPSFEEIDDTRIQGSLSLQQLTAKAEQLAKPINAKSRLRFNGEKVRINDTQASIRDIVARVDGRINWEKGYDVDIIVPPFGLNKLQDIAPIDLPVDVTGKVKANLELKGAIKEPLLRGKISNTQPVTVAETKLDEVETEITASLKKVVLEDLRVIPAAGGEITGQGLLDTIDGVTNLNLNVGSGDISIRSQLNSGNLEVAANATEVPVNDFLTGIELPEPINARVNLSASLNSIRDGAVAIDTNNLSVQLGEQTFNTQGKILVEDLASNPIVNADLDLQANSNLNRLPNQLLNNISANNEFLASNFDLKGNAAFTGNLQGNLLNPSNLDLTGDLQLENFSIGNVAFDPTLSGTIDFSYRDDIVINLEGQQDVIAVNLEPCKQDRCAVPYLPTDIEIRQGEDTPEPIIATANRQGEFLDVDVANFPLSILNLQLGVPGELAGELTGEALVNLFTLAATGEARVVEPSVGYIDGEAITADFAYSPEQNLARLNSATLKFGESIYILEGAYNLQTRSIEGKLDIPQAYIQDLISAFGWYNIQRVTELFQPPDIVEADALSALEVGEKNARVGYLLKLLVLVTERLEQMAQESDILTTPLDIQGVYRGEVAIAGSLNSPQIAWDISGNDWLWDTSSEVVFEIPRREGIIVIEKLLLAGNYNSEGIILDSFVVRDAQSLIALEGRLKGDRINADYNIRELPIEAIDNFIDIPIELAGRIDTSGEVAGALPTPKVVGDIALTNGRLSDRNLPKITGNYIYNNARLELDTTETPSAQIQASIPFPVKPNNDFVSLQADIDEGGIALIDGFTGGALEFIGGEADITLNANGSLDLSRDFIIQDLDAVGEITLSQSILKTSAFTEPLNVTAEIAIDEKLIQVEQLAGTFAKSEIAASGVLPLFNPQADINNPLTLAFQESKIDLDRLYEGGVAGEVVITGDAFRPLIGGKIELFDGQAFVPDNESESEDTEAEVNAIASEIGSITSENSDNTDTESAFQPEFKDFQVDIEDLRFQLASIYKIILEGDLILNGAANNVPEINADGKLYLTRADVDFVSSEFNLQQAYNNVIVFDPEVSILNPFVDIRLETEVSELDDVDFGVVEDNEIPDPISQAGRNEIINVLLIVNGEAEQIIPRVNEDADRLCRLEPPLEPLFAEEIYTQQELNQLAECINYNAFDEDSVRELLNSPAVNLESNPPRSQGAILSLLGNNFIDLAEQLQDSNEEQLLEFGLAQFVLTPLEREVFSFADETINNLGEDIGLDYLRIYPALEGTYQLSNDSSVSATYDYFFNEVKVRYQKQF